MFWTTSLTAHCSLFTVLPYFDSFLRFSIEFVTFFYLESLVPSLHVGQWGEGTEVVRSVWVCLDLVGKVLISSQGAPYGSPRDEEAFVLGESTYFSYITTVFYVHL